MKHKQAYIKLASLRLAINYVLRNRSMTKSASEWTNPLIGAGLGAGLGYLLSPEKHKLLGTLGGGLLGGAAGYGFDQLNKPSPKSKPNPEEEYGYLDRLEDATASNAGGLYPDKELVDESNNRLSNPRDLVSRMFYSDVSPEEVAKSSTKYYEIYNDHPYKEQIGEPKENTSESVIDTPKETKSNKPFDINAILFGSKEKGVPTPAGAPYPIELYEEEANKLIPLPKQRFSILEKTEDTPKEEPKLPMDTRWLRELERQSSVNLGGGYYSYFPKTYTPLRLRIGLPEDAPTPSELADKIDAGEATQEDINKWVPFYYEGYNRLFDPDLWDKSEEYTDTPAVDSGV